MIDIIYKDESVVVCLKRPGELSQVGKPGEKSLLAALETELGGTIYPVHRLDREAGGVMVYARTKKAAASLSAAVQEHRLEKEYVCIVRGAPQEESGDYHDLLLHDKQRNKTFVVNRMRGGVKEARLSYRVLRKNDAHALVRVALQTGRTHQIRVQFASRKHPLVGDHKYGSKDEATAPMLFSCCITFPWKGKEMRFEKLPGWAVV